MQIGIGSNINAEENLHACAELLRKQWPDVRFSHVYKTSPRDFEDQEDFLNAVASLETDEPPKELKAVLEEIERRLGKNLPHPKGPRTIDLDLLLYNDLVLETSELTIPHPRMHERRFVLEPLLELLGPGGSKDKWNAVLQSLMGQKCERTDIRL